MKYAIPLGLIGSMWLLLASDPGTADWPMWGGTPDRNMLSTMAGIPTSWDIHSKKNVKWMADLGSQSYGNAVVAAGQVYVGTNNELVRNPKEGGDRGVLMCFRESDGDLREIQLDKIVPELSRHVVVRGLTIRSSHTKAGLMSGEHRVRFAIH